MIKQTVLALSAVALAAAPVAAQTAPRAGSSVSEEENLGAAGSIPVILAIAAVAAGAIIIATDDDDDYEDLPVSP